MRLFTKWTYIYTLTFESAQIEGQGEDVTYYGVTGVMSMKILRVSEKIVNINGTGIVNLPFEISGGDKKDSP